MRKMNTFLAATALAVFASPAMAQVAAEADAGAGAEVTSERLLKLMIPDARLQVHAAHA